MSLLTSLDPLREMIPSQDLASLSLASRSFQVPNPQTTERVKLLEADLSYGRLELEVKSLGQVLHGQSTGEITFPYEEGLDHYQLSLTFHQGQLDQAWLKWTVMETEAEPRAVEEWRFLFRGAGRGIYRRDLQEREPRLKLTLPLDRHGLIHGVVCQPHWNGPGLGLINSYFHGNPVSRLSLDSPLSPQQLDLVGVTDRGFLYLANQQQLEEISPTYRLEHTNLSLTAEEKASDETLASFFRLKRYQDYQTGQYHRELSQDLPIGWSMRSNGFVSILDARQLNYDDDLSELDSSVDYPYQVLALLKKEGYLFNWSPSQSVIDQFYSPANDWLIVE